MNLSLKSILCGIIALNAYAFAQEECEEAFDAECYKEQYWENRCCPRQYVFRFVPWYPEGDALREERQDSRWPSKRTFELFDRVSQ